MSFSPENEEKTCADCSHPMENHKDADCAECQDCNIEKGDRLHDAAKEEGPDPMDATEDYSGQQEYGRTDARLGLN